MRIIACAIVLAVAAAAPSWAGPDERVAIPTLFNTGVDESGHPLADGTLGDPHYRLTAVPYPATSDVIVFQGVGPDGKPPIGPWAGNDDLSAWIAPDEPDPRNAATVGEYYYSTSFDLTGFDPASAVIYGAWAADDVGAEVILNGQKIAILTSLAYGPQNYTGLTTFNYYAADATGAVVMTPNAPLQTGFVAGLNTLTFRADNGGGATGLRVEMSGSAVPIPEPASLALLCVVLLMLAAAGRVRCAAA